MNQLKRLTKNVTFISHLYNVWNAPVETLQHEEKPAESKIKRRYLNYNARYSLSN